MELYSECAASLFALAKKEKNLRSKKYLLEHATAMANLQNDMEVVIRLYNLAIDGAKRLKENSHV